MPPSTAPTTISALVTFDVGGDHFALDIMGIVQIIKYEGSTEVPRAPDFVEGIILLRDHVIPVVDLRKRLFSTDRPDGASKRILIVRLGGILVGLKVDVVRKIVSVQASEILPAPAIIQGIDAKFVEGVVRIEEQVVLLVDLERILSLSEQKALGRALETTPDLTS